MIQARLLDNQNGREIEVAETLMIGRREGCQLQIKETNVSRQHAIIREEDGRYWLFDLGSSNGSYLNGNRVVDGERLRDGDVIRIGKCRFTFATESGTSGATTSTDLTGYSMDQTRLDISTVPVLMLVSDIKGFSQLSEKLPTDVLARAMSSWYRECKMVIEKCGATVDKFIGDAVLAYWMDVSAGSRSRALVAARSLAECSVKISQDHSEEFEQAGVSFGIGCGIHLGEVAHGKLGREAFTLIGGAVNATFGLEALTRDVGEDVLVSAAVLAEWPEGERFCESRGMHKVKGKTLPLELFAVNSWPEITE